MSRSKQQPRHRRLDIINSLKRGEQKQIARQLNCSRGHVSAVLNGRTNQHNDLGRNVIRLAEHAANSAKRLNRFK
ncbi:MAG: hypothetical protein ACK5JD_11025 [Mangrovibacterium sp.]